MGHYYADIGFVEYASVTDGPIDIRSYVDVDQAVRATTAEKVYEQWAAETGCSSPIDAEAYLDRRFASGGGDVLYVMTRHGAFVGCVGIDRQQFYPFITNLLVAAEHRGQGCAKRLLAFAEDFIRAGLKFGEARLWCKPEMVPFYENVGYATEDFDQSKQVAVMVRRLGGDPLTQSASVDAADSSFLSSSSGGMLGFSSVRC